MDPNDNLSAYFDNRKMLFYPEVHAKGKYPAWKIKDLEDRGIKLDASPEEWEIIKNNTVDFLAFSYYMSGLSKANSDNGEKTYSNEMTKLKNPYISYTEWDWPVDPVGLRILANMLWDSYQKPLMVVENGFAKIESLTKGKDGELTVEDDYRIEALRDHLLELNKAMGDGVEFLAYTNWAVEDFVSGTTGTMKKDGVLSMWIEMTTDQEA